MIIEKYIRARLQKKPICLMTHVIAGYPSFADNFKALEIMAQNDVDIIEIQMPFSEPIADGPTFVRANQKALATGITVAQYFDFMASCSRHFDFPILMMGYYNTVFKMGEDKFLHALEQAGGRGFILPDLPVEEGENLFRQAKEKQLAPITMMTPTTSTDRLSQLGKAGSGFVYVVARKGVTGAHTTFDAGFRDYIQRCRNATSLPLAMGFGVASSEDLNYLSGKVEMAIIGTALLRQWEEAGASGLSEFFKKLQ